MEPERRPPPLGDRLDVVAAVCAAAALVVLAAGTVAAMAADLPSGAAPADWQQRILLATQGVGFGVAMVVVVGASALTLRRWLGGDEPTVESRIAALVRAAAVGVALFAVAGTVGNLLWAGDATYFRMRLVGDGSAVTVLGLLAAWLVRP